MADRLQVRILVWGFWAAAAGAWDCAAQSNAVARAPDIVVTATRTEMSSEDVAASVEVIDRDTIARSGARTVDDLCRNVAGVDLQGGGVPGSAVRLNLRGLTPGYQSERLLVLVDGRRVNDPFQGNVEFALLPAGNVERVEILHGPASALYGSNAMGGVINIVTRRGTVIPFTQVSAAAGSFDTRRFVASHARKVGNTDYAVAGSHVSTDGYMKNSDGTQRDWLATDASGNLGVALGSNAEVRVFAGAYEGSGTDENSERDVQKNHQAAQYRVNWDDEREASTLARAYRNGERYVYDWNYPGEGIYRLEALGTEIQHSFLADARNRVTLGAEGRRDSADVTEVASTVDESSTLAAGYAQDELRLTESVRLTAGTRYDHETDYGGQWSPRAGILWQACEFSEVYASFGQAYRAPALSDRYVSTEFNGLRFEGNPDLDPETLTAYEGGLRVRLADRLRGALALFYNRLEDSFDFLYDSDGVFRNQNVSRSHTGGAEARLDYRIADGWTAFANYTYTDGEYDEFEGNPGVEGNLLAYLAQNKAAAGVEYVTPAGSSCAIGGRYVGTRYGDPANSPENRMDDYVAVDARARLALCESAALTLNIDNLFDRSYQDFPTYDQPGRWFMAGVEVTF